MSLANAPAVDGKASASQQMTTVKVLSFLMFFMFALTTDSVGAVIPAIIREFGLSLTAAGAFHYATMSAMAIAGFFLGFVADKFGHKRTILLGLAVFAVASLLFVLGRTYSEFVLLLFISGLAIGLFRTGALAMIGDLADSNVAHTRLMNIVEGFFGLGGIVGPALVALLLSRGASWRWLYAITGMLCTVLLGVAACARYPLRKRDAAVAVNLGATVKMLGNRWAMGFSIALFLYVAVECAVYVWMPTLLQSYRGSPLGNRVGFALSAFFILRAIGRFAGSWLLGRFDWTAITASFSLLILLCFAGAVWGRPSAAVVLLPLSGLFMSVIYPTLNSKAMSCFPKVQHGTVAGMILFFSCLAASIGPLAMGAVSDSYGGPRGGFLVATGFATLLFIGLVGNWLFQPTRERLSLLDNGPGACENA